MPARRITSTTLAAMAKGEVAYDSIVPGFLAQKLANGRVAFLVRRKGKHPIHRVIGNDALMNLSDAREAARKILAQHVIDRSTERGKRYTLETAWPLYKAALIEKSRSPETIINYQKSLNRLSTRFRNTTLRMLADNPELFAVEHDRIKALGHRAAADMSGRTIRAIYHYIRNRHDRTLPEQSPTIDREIRSKDAVNPRVVWEQHMREWWQRVQKLRDPIRREAHLFMMLSGLRPGSARHPGSLSIMKVEHYHPLDPRLLEIKRTKTRPFTLILSTHMQACLKRSLQHAGATGRANGHLFPATRGKGALTELADDAKVTGFGPRELRRSYATMGDACGVPERKVGSFLNHKKSMTMTARYILTDPEGPLLREYQQRISDRIIKALGDPALVEEPGDADQETLDAWERDSTPLQHLLNPR